MLFLIFYTVEYSQDSFIRLHESQNLYYEFLHVQLFIVYFFPFWGVEVWNVRGVKKYTS